MKADKKIEPGLALIKKKLAGLRISCVVKKEKILFKGDRLNIDFLIAGEFFDYKKNTYDRFIPTDYLVRQPLKVAHMILSKLNLNEKIFARNCELRKIDKTSAAAFLDAYHLMGSTESASNLGLFYANELVAVASFSKGRKMNRLPDDKRSFELIRFCCKPGITITGGLSKLVKNFYIEKNAGDIMTYVDRQLSDGSSFIKAGFKKHSETPPNFFLVNKKTFERSPLTSEEILFDKKNFYISQNSGNLKMIYQPIEKI